MHDVPDETTAESTYECLRCGNIVVKDSHPGECEECGGSFQNRANSLE